MKTLGHMLFGRNAHWLVKRTVTRFPSAVFNIFMSHGTEISETEVGYAMLDYFEPEPLDIGTPTLTQMSWDTSSWVIAKAVEQRYIHEAQVPYSGTDALWRLRGSESGTYRSKVKISDKSVRLLMLRPDRDVEAWRQLVEEELVMAKREAGSQDKAIAWHRFHLPSHVEQYLNHNSIDDIRDYARERREAADRVSKRL